MKNLFIFILLGSFSGFAQMNLTVEKPDLPAEVWQQKQYMRAKGYAARRDAAGIINTEWARWQEWQKIQGLNSHKMSQSNKWTNFGPHKISGRIISVAFHPTDTNTIYVGAAGGGLWKTIDYGKKWVPLTDFIPSLAVGAIAINPKNPLKILIATGEGYLISNEFTTGIGVLMSNDGGITFKPTGISAQLSQGFAGMDIIWSPKDTNKVCVASSFGVYFSNDGGNTYTYVLNRMPARMIADPKHPDTLYLAARYYNSTYQGGMYRSFNAGQTWTQIGTGLPTPTNMGYTSLAVHPVYTNMLFANVSRSSVNGLGPLVGLYKSINYGLNWKKITTNVDIHCYQPPYQNVCQGWYANTTCISPTDTNTLYAGGTRLWKSVNGGSTWKNCDTINNVYAVHPDHHQTLYHPLTGHLFDFNDGGVNYTNDAGANWVSLSDGLITHQFYTVAFADTDPDLVIGGAQDVGFFSSSLAHTSTSWTNNFSGDAFGCAIDHTDANIWYGTIFMNYRRIKTPNAGFNWGFLNNGTSSDDQWRMPMVMHPTNPLVLLSSDDNFTYKTVNGGSLWTTTSNVGYKSSIEYDKINTNLVYSAVLNAGNVYRSVNGGNSWTALSSSPGSPITDLASDPSQHAVVYASIGSFASNDQIFKSLDSGVTWVNISNNLPAVPVNSIVVDPFDSKIIYVGNDLGVWVTQDGGNTWSDFNNASLPYVVVEDVHYYKPDSTIRVGTYGRGYWRIKALLPSISSIKTESIGFVEASLYPNPLVKGNSALLKIVSRENEIASIKIINTVGQQVSFQSSKLVAGINEINIISPKSAGVYFLSLTVGKASKNLKFIITD